VDEEETEIDPLLAAHMDTSMPISRSLFQDTTLKQSLISVDVEAWLEEYDKEKRLEEEKKIRDLEIEYGQKI